MFRSKHVTAVAIVALVAVMGVYFTFSSHASSNVADINNDGNVNVTDLSILLTNWNRTGATQAQGDLNASGTVNITDLSILLSNWGVVTGSNCVGTQITTSTNVQTAINNAPTGTTFCFAAGTYHGTIVPKTGDILDGGNQTAILDGQNSTQWAIAGGFDAFGNNWSTASNVTVRGFVIQNYNTPLQDGAIQTFEATGWTIQNNHITHNAASGVATDSGTKVLSNLIDWNGQEGYAVHGSNSVYDGNEIAHNNPNLTIDAGWEGGGGKANHTINAKFTNNFVHDNGGNAMWSDTGNIYTTYDHNTVTNNSGAGIYHEISYDAVITNNTVSSNGMPSSPGGGLRGGWLFNAGIQLRRSGAVNPPTIPPPAGWPSVGILLVANNTLTNNYNSVALIESPANGGGGNDPSEAHLPDANNTLAPNFCQNILVRDNTIIMSQGATGAVEDGGGGSEDPHAIFNSHNNHFTHNTYHVSNLTHPNDGYTFGWHAWMDGWPSWSQWQGYGNDTTGSFGL